MSKWHGFKVGEEKRTSSTGVVEKLNFSDDSVTVYARSHDGVGNVHQKKIMKCSDQDELEDARRAAKRIIQVNEFEKTKEGREYVAKNLTVEEGLQEFMEIKESDAHIRPQSLDQYRGHLNNLRKYLRLHAPHITLFRNISETEVRGFMIYLHEEKKFTDPTVRNNLITIRMMFAELKGDGKILSNPFETRSIKKSVRKYKAQNRKRAFTPEQANLIVMEAHKMREYDCRDFYRLLVGSGLRRAEASYLRWIDVHLDEENPVVKVVEREGFVAKTPFALREIGLDDVTLQMLKIRKVAAIRDNPRFKKMDFVFPDIPIPPNTYWHYNKPWRLLHKIMKTLGIERVNEDGRLVLHSFRHTYATMICNDPEVALPVAQRMCGHANIQTTMDYVKSDGRVETEVVAKAVSRKLNNSDPIFRSFFGTPPDPKPKRKKGERVMERNRPNRLDK